MTELWGEWVLVVVAVLLAAMSPGPDFVVTVRNAVGSGRAVSVVSGLGGLALERYVHRPGPGRDSGIWGAIRRGGLPQGVSDQPPQSEGHAVFSGAVHANRVTRRVACGAGFLRVERGLGGVCVVRAGVHPSDDARDSGTVSGGFAMDRPCVRGVFRVDGRASGAGPRAGTLKRFFARPA
jgi:hypothetical protein